MKKYLRKYVLSSEIDYNLRKTQAKYNQIALCGACFVVLGAILGGAFIVQFSKYVLGSM